MIRLLKRKAQNIAEYAVIIGVVASAMIGMQTYLQRSIQGIIKLSADELGVQYEGLERDLKKKEYTVRTIDATEETMNKRVDLDADDRTMTLVSEERIDSRTDLVNMTLGDFPLAGYRVGLSGIAETD